MQEFYFNWILLAKILIYLIQLGDYLDTIVEDLTYKKKIRNYFLPIFI